MARGCLAARSSPARTRGRRSARAARPGCRRRRGTSRTGGTGRSAPGRRIPRLRRRPAGCTGEPGRRPGMPMPLAPRLADPTRLGCRMPVPAARTGSAPSTAPPGFSAGAATAEPGLPGGGSGEATGSGRAESGRSAECRDARRRFDGGRCGVSASSSNRPPARALTATAATMREKTTAQTTDSRVSAAAARPPISAAAVSTTDHRWNPRASSGSGGRFACGGWPFISGSPVPARRPEPDSATPIASEAPLVSQSSSG